KLSSEFGLHLTYMEVRLLIDDLKLKPKDQAVPRQGVADLKSAAGAAQSSGTLAKPGTTGAPSDAFDEEGSGVSVSVDQVTRAGALVSGKVSFSDGNSAEWY